MHAIARLLIRAFLFATSFPGILNQLGAESLTHLKRLASNVGGAGVGGAMEA